MSPPTTLPPRGQVLVALRLTTHTCSVMEALFVDGLWQRSSPSLFRHVKLDVGARRTLSQYLYLGARVQCRHVARTCLLVCHNLYSMGQALEGQKDHDSLQQRTGWTGLSDISLPWPPPFTGPQAVLGTETSVRVSNRLLESTICGTL